MNYEIQSRSDFLTGSYLVVRIPEKELDQCALYTIQAESPDFILPFFHKGSDGKMEFIYKVGTLCKLQYFSGELSPGEYTELWQSLLKPLLECADWFMNPCSFLLNADYLYYDKSKKAVRYVYVPSAYGCSGNDAFYEMAVEVSKMMTVSDSVLENKVLRAVIKDFNPIEFLQMLKDHIAESASCSEDISVIENKGAKEDPDVLSGDGSDLEISTDIFDGIIFDITPEIDFNKAVRERGPGGYRIFGRRGRRRKIQQPGLPGKSSLRSVPEKSEIHVENEQSALALISEARASMEIIDITQSTSIVSEGPGLRYVGCAQLPPSIQIVISEGEIFTIGRFDATIGKRQSSFEFDKKTRAVSRRHAVIERDINGYKIVDLSSSAGTFVNEKRLPPNTPHGLETGCRVSFGNSGADYVWEVS